MTEQASGETLYRKEPKVYPRQVTGRFARLRVIAVWVLLGLFYLLPWLTLGGKQAMLFDLPARKFYLFGLTFWPQDFVYLALLLITAGLTLFFFTALAGRLWCGFACPQTVWTEVFIWIERHIEGDRPKRMKLDAAPWNVEKVLRKTAKQAVWILFAAWTGFTFVGFFTPIRELGHNVLTLSLGPWETFWTVFYGFATYGNAGFLREQVCKYMCPYARFQSAMFDKDTLIISYDEDRGEPRGSSKRGDDPAEKGLGDCIDCTLCVQVCPTGIDIREGLQYECIACAACIDACDSVMDKMNYPRGLVRFTTENALKRKPSRVLRPRTVIYATLLLVLCSGLVYSLATRTPLILDVIRDRNSLYREISDDRVENIYTLKLINQSHEARSFVLKVNGFEGIELDGAPDQVVVEGGGVMSLPVRVRAHRDDAQGIHTIHFSATAVDDPGVRVEEDSRFLGPTP